MMVGTMRQFAHIIEWSDEDNCYVGTVPSMPGCMATGNTIEATMQELEAAKREWRAEVERLRSESDTSDSDVFGGGSWHPKPEPAQ